MHSTDQELLRRAEDLSRRSVKKWEMTCSGFLTPAESRVLRSAFRPEDHCEMVFFGGYSGAERCVAFFLPEGEAQEAVADMIRAVRYQAFFGEPGHRDYLGALLASGISRDRLGDILISGAEATVFCLPGVLGHLLTLDRIGKVHVRAEEIPLRTVEVPERAVRELSFTVMSLRLDAVTAGMFRLSRSSCAELIRAGLMSLNYSVCDRVDAPVREGDTLSLRGHGKGVLTEVGGQSRKGRLFIKAEVYV